MRDTFPVDPDSIIQPHPQNTDDTVFFCSKNESGTPAVCSHHTDKHDTKSCSHWCPTAKADSVNEKYAVFIRSSFSGRQSELTLAMSYLYQSIKFACCSHELCSVFYELCLSKTTPKANPLQLFQRYLYAFNAPCWDGSTTV